jgi:hypothetical protein
MHDARHGMSWNHLYFFSLDAACCHYCFAYVVLQKQSYMIMACLPSSLIILVGARRTLQLPMPSAKCTSQLQDAEVVAALRLLRYLSDVCYCCRCRVACCYVAGYPGGCRPCEPMIAATVVPVCSCMHGLSVFCLCIHKWAPLLR